MEALAAGPAHPPEYHVRHQTPHDAQRSGAVSLREMLSDYWFAFQQELFPRLESELGPMGERYELFVSVLELVRVEALLPYFRGQVGPTSTVCHRPGHGFECAFAPMHRVSALQPRIGVPVGVLSGRPLGLWASGPLGLWASLYTREAGAGVQRRVASRDRAPAAGADASTIVPDAPSQPVDAILPDTCSITCPSRQSSGPNPYVSLIHVPEPHSPQRSPRNRSKAKSATGSHRMSPLRVKRSCDFWIYQISSI